MIKGNNNNNSYKFMCVTMVDPAVGILEIEEIPTLLSINDKGTTDEVFDKKSACMSRMIFKNRLCWNHGPGHVICHNSKKLKIHFAALCN